MVKPESDLQMNDFKFCIISTTKLMDFTAWSVNPFLH